MIDGMVSQLGDRVEKLWKRDEGGTGKYPPPSLHVGLQWYHLRVPKDVGREVCLTEFSHLAQSWEKQGV